MPARIIRAVSDLSRPSDGNAKVPAGGPVPVVVEAEKVDGGAGYLLI